MPWTVRIGNFQTTDHKRRPDLVASNLVHAIRQPGQFDATDLAGMAVVVFHSDDQQSPIDGERRLLGVDASTVRRWRTSRPPQGPPFVQLSERVTMYSAADVEQWLLNRRVDPGEAA